MFLARLEWMPNIVNWTVAGLEAAMFAGLPQHGPHAIAGANARLAAGIAFEPNDFGTAWLSRHTLRKSQMHEKIRYCSQTNGPKVARSAGGDRDDLVDTPALRGGRLVRHGGLLCRQRLGHSFCTGLYDGKSEHRWEHHEVCRARRSGQQLRPRRTTVWPGWPHGAVRRSTGPADAFQSFPRLRLQLHTS